MNQRIAKNSFFGSHGTHETLWFLGNVNKDSPIAPTPGTPDAHAMSVYGRVHISFPGRIEHVHFHYEHPSGTGQYSLELWRKRGWNQNPPETLIATCTTSGSGDWSIVNFEFIDDSFRDVERCDYLLLQVTSKMTGAGSKDASGFVDIHFAE